MSEHRGQQAPTQVHAVSSEAKEYLAAQSACRLPTDLPIYLQPHTVWTEVPEEVLGYLSSSVCKAEPCAGHLNQPKSRNSAAEYT